jgi:tetratricopeptide (TPR) repeat protein
MTTTTTSPQRTRYLSRRALLLILLTVSLLAVALAPRLVSAAQRNRLARQTAILCQQPGGDELPVARSGATWLEAVRETAWFEAALARCRDDEATARLHWAAGLQHSPRRLDAIRAAAPFDLELARLTADLYPDNPDAHFWLAEAYREQGDAVAAITAYEAGLALTPGDGLTWRILGDLYRDAGYDWQTVAQTYDRACFRFDIGGNGCLRAGRLYLEHEQYDIAADRYRQSLQQIPGFARAHQGAAAALLAQGKTTEARPHLQTLADQGNDWAREQLRELDGGQ